MHNDTSVYMMILGIVYMFCFSRFVRCLFACTSLFIELMSSLPEKRTKMYNLNLVNKSGFLSIAITGVIHLYGTTFHTFKKCCMYHPFLGLSMQRSRVTAITFTAIGPFQHSIFHHLAMITDGRHLGRKQYIRPSILDKLPSIVHCDFSTMFATLFCKSFRILPLCL